MAYYKVDKTMQYTVTVYIEAESSKQAEDNAGAEEGQINNDDTWYDAHSVEITKEEYESETE